MSRAERCHVELAHCTGAKADAYLAVHRGTGHDVVLKFLRSKDPDDILRFTCEAMLPQTFDHPALPRFYDHAPEASPPYIAMAHAPGRPASRLCSPPRLRPNEVAAVGVKTMVGSAPMIPTRCSRFSSRSLGWLLAAACGGFFGSMGCSLVQAVERGDLAGLQRQLDKGADPNEVDGRGVTALGQAIRDENKEAVKILLAHGANANAMSTTRDGPRSPIGIAFDTLKPRFYSVEAGAPIESGTEFPEVVAMLLDAGAEVDGKTPEHTPLGLAVACAVSQGRGDQEARRAARCEAVAVALLARGADPNEEGDNRLTPLELLIRTMNGDLPEAVHWSRILLLNGAKTDLDRTLAAVVDDVGRGASARHSQMVRRSFFGQTHSDDLKIAAMHEARVRGAMEAVSLSLALGADPNGPPGGGYYEFRGGSTIVEAVAHALTKKEWPETQELLDMLIKAGGVVTAAAAADLEVLRKNRQARRERQIMQFIKGATVVLTVATLAGLAANNQETSMEPLASEPPPPPTKRRRGSRNKPPLARKRSPEPAQDAGESCPERFPSSGELARVDAETYKIHCPNERPAFVHLLKKEGKWVGESNYAPLVFDRTGVRSTPEAASRWECGCRD